MRWFWPKVNWSVAKNPIAQEIFLNHHMIRQRGKLDLIHVKHALFRSGRWASFFVLRIWSRSTVNDLRLWTKSIIIESMPCLGQALKWNCGCGNLVQTLTYLFIVFLVAANLLRVTSNDLYINGILWTRLCNPDIELKLVFWVHAGVNTGKLSRSVKVYSIAHPFDCSAIWY